MGGTLHGPPGCQWCQGLSPSPVPPHPSRASLAVHPTPSHCTPIHTTPPAAQQRPVGVGSGSGLGLVWG